MKLKTLLISCLMSLVGLTASAQTTLWSASDQENGDELGWNGIGKEKFPATLNVGDEITINGVVVTGSWNWVNLCAIDNTSYEWWSPGTKIAEITGSTLPSTITFFISEEMITAISDLGLFFECGTYIDGGGSTFKAKSIIYTPVPAKIESFNILEAADQVNGQHFGGTVLTKQHFHGKSIAVGDEITINAVSLSSDEWYEYTFENPSGGDYRDYLRTGFNSEDLPCSFTARVNSAMADAVNNGAGMKFYANLNITSFVYTPKALVRSVNIETQSPAKEMDWEWWNYGINALPASAFVGAQAGDMLTINVNSLGSADTHTLVISNATNNDWVDFSRRNITESGIYKFVLTDEMVTVAKAGNLRLYGDDYFYSSIDLVYAPTVNVNAAAEYATFSYNEKLDLTGIEAYAVSATSTTSATLASIEGKKVAANTGMILYKAGGGAVRIPFTTDDTDAITNSLIGTATGAVVGPTNAYVLANKSDVVGFYKLKSGQTIAANKAYLTIAAGAREFIGFGENEVTSIADVSSKKIEFNGDIFDLQGRKVSQPKKGLYIVNGKKVVIK